MVLGCFSCVSRVENPYLVQQLLLLLLMVIAFREWRAERPTPRPFLRLLMFVAAVTSCLVGTGAVGAYYTSAEIGEALCFALYAASFVTFGLVLEVILDSRHDDFARAVGRATASPARSGGDRPERSRGHTNHPTRDASHSASESERV